MEILKLLYVFPSRNADAAISLLHTVTALAKLSGGIKAMLLQSKLDIMALRSSEDAADDAPPATLSSPWPWSRDECLATEFSQRPSQC
ncbi:hypothetical protein P43SY_011818 [Pythium insidiosum]|uniref:Uncharacterized protein n=1 Tax=Pythium insidiosum TaxID=114742 RepID=A0AAD5Q452_PYTIN|nr:hypothetical protein P43SY_011818 [Pythium insidiosum]